MVTATPAPVEFDDPVNAAILAVSEDKLQGFHRDPLGDVAERPGIELDTVIERIRAMLDAGTIRRVRQTLLSTNLAPGALVAWRVPQEKLSAAFDFMFQRDPFSGHVVIRTTDAGNPGRSVQALDDAQGPAPVLDDGALRLSRASRPVPRRIA